jgi:hypothetical protein
MAFSARRHLTDEIKIREGIKRAEFVKKEIEALYAMSLGIVSKRPVLIVLDTI